MEAELVTLASSGASALVGLMVSDGWEQAKTRVAHLLGRRVQVEAITAELDSAQIEAMRERADTAVMADLEAVWRLRFRQLLASDPEAAIELRQFLNALGVQPPQSSADAITLRATAQDDARVYQVGRGDMHVGDA